jgi:nicotinamidase-related amidase
MHRAILAALLLACLPAAGWSATAGGWPAELVLHTRREVPSPGDSQQFDTVYGTVRWDARKTAVIVCDMWDKHWCAAASRRVAEMAPRVNRFLIEARQRGALVVHAPSDTMSFYKDTPQRKLAQQAPRVEPEPKGAPPLIGWQPLDPRREGPLPIDDSDSGCPCHPKCHAYRAWTRQIETIHIEPGDAVADDAQVYYLLQQRGIENVILLGVHVNMCVLGRPFGIRQMVGHGKNVLLVRDLTDSMYNPERRPQASHFRGTELVVEHIERHWCPTIASSDLLPGPPLCFAEDRRPRVVLVSYEPEYGSLGTLSRFARQLADRCDYSCTVLPGEEPEGIRGLEALATADVLLLYMRRHPLPPQQMAAIHRYLATGKPLVALRTACHAFAPPLREAVPAGLEAWPAFDTEVLGCHYHGHYMNEGTEVHVVPVAATSRKRHPILAGLPADPWTSPSSLYQVSPLEPEVTVLLAGKWQEHVEPVAWTRQYGRSRVFYTSLGHPGDFQSPAFCTLLINALHWAVEKPVPGK